MFTGRRACNERDWSIQPECRRRRNAIRMYSGTSVVTMEIPFIWRQYATHCSFDLATHARCSIRSTGTEPTTQYCQGLAIIGPGPIGLRHQPGTLKRSSRPSGLKVKADFRPSGVRSNNSPAANGAASALRRRCCHYRGSDIDMGLPAMPRAVAARSISPLDTRLVCRMERWPISITTNT